MSATKECLMSLEEHFDARALIGVERIVEVV